MGITEIFVGIVQLFFQLFIFIAIFRVWKSRSVVRRVISQNTSYSENKDYISAATFFNTIEKHLSAREITGLSFSKAILKENTAFEGSRTYMVIRRANIIYYISTFSLGNTQIFSYWQIEPFAFWRRVWSVIPIFGKMILAFFFPNSLFKMDEAAGMTSVIQHDLKAALDELLGEEGYHLNSPVKEKEIHKMFFG